MNHEVFPGLYRGIVVRTDDPESRGRVVVKVPALNGDGEFDWALPCIPPLAFTASTTTYNSNLHIHGAGTTVHARLKLPELGAAVWIMFEHGDPDQPVWLGSWRV